MLLLMTTMAITSIIHNIIFYRSAPKKKCPSVCPCGDPWRTLLQSKANHSWAPIKPPRGQTLRSLGQRSLLCLSDT